MPRCRRLQYSGAVYHVMARGNRRSAIFDDDLDRRIFWTLLGQTAERYAFRIYGACLMANHYHVFGETPAGNLSDTMRYLNGVFAQATNRRHGRTGHLFEARFRSLVIQRESYLKRVARYVVLNPVRARLVPDAAAWTWSTYRATAGLEQAPDWLALDWLELAFHAASGPEAQDRYRRYVNEPAGPKARINTRALAFGTRRFRERIAAHAGCEPDRLLPSGFRTSPRPQLEAALAGVAPHSPGLAEAVYAAYVTHGYRQSEIAAHLGLHPSGVSRLLAKFLASRRG